MAKRYALVPETWLQQQQQQNSQKSFETTASTPQVSVTSFVEEPKSLTNISELLPKNLRNRARMVLYYLENANIRVNDVQRIVYEDGSLGSHIIDLVRYAISPFVKTRPLDWPRFKNLLENIGAPKSILAKRNETALKNWRPY